MHFSPWKYIIVLYIVSFLTVEMQLFFVSHLVSYFSREWTAFIACRPERKDIQRDGGDGLITLLH